VMVDPHSGLLCKPPLPRSTGERKGALRRGRFFLSPGQGERWPEGPEWGCLLPLNS
jgi:hypothetical protein